jgi:predicted MPP superfamily phosphohydrolase
MRAVWATDIHLNFLTTEERKTFFCSIVQENPDVLFITGDIAEAPTLQPLLLELIQSVQRPLYFVLGNHDFYYSSIPQVRTSLQQFCNAHQNLFYLSDNGIVELTKTTALIGHDGWGDGRHGNYVQSPVRLSDNVLIQELAGLDYGGLIQKLRQLGDEAASAIHEPFREALDSYQHIIILTHVPPFKEACWYQGRIGGDDWLPFFTCKAVGDLLLEVLQSRPNSQVTVLCGHTHNEGIAQILPNLRVITGSAEYGSPHVQQIFEVA